MERFMQSTRIKEDPRLIGQFTQDSMRLEAEYDIDFNMWKMRLETEVLKERVAEDYYETEVYYATPRTWWDMFKETYATRWWFNWYSKRWGAPHYDQHTLKARVKVERSVLYPEADVPRPPLGRPYIYEKVNFV